MSLPRLAPTETERAAVARFVFDVDDVAAVRRRLVSESVRRDLDVASAGPERFMETILDTRDRRLQRAGTWLVRRDFGDGSELIWRALPDADEAHLWTSIALPSAEAAIPGDCPEPLRGRLAAVVGRRAVRPVLRLHVVREEWVVKRRGSWLATIVLTDASGDRDLSWKRAEWRVRVDASGAPDSVLATLASKEGQIPVEASIHEAALQAADARAPKRRDVGSTDVFLGMTTGDLAYAVMRRQFREIAKREPGTRLGEDPEELHKLRVAVRRMRAALRLWRPCLAPEAHELQQAWGALGRALGETRDLDVEAENFAQWTAEVPVPDKAALAPVEGWLRGRRLLARDRMIEALDAPSHERLVRITSRWLRVGPGRGLATRRPARRAAVELVKDRYRALSRRARSIDSASPPEAYHRVRILGKHLRYCLEFHAPLLGPAARELVRHLVAMQDQLGEVQDYHVFLDRFGRLGEDASVPATPRALELLHERIEERRVRALALRDAFPEVFAALRGAPWKQLKSELGARR